MSAEAYQQAASVENVRDETVPAGRAVTGGELVALLDTCNHKPQGIRDAAIISLLYSSGLRRTEAAGLNIGDYDSGGSWCAASATSSAACPSSPGRRRRWAAFCTYNRL